MNPETDYFEPALSLDRLAESTINPRRTFNPEQLQELAGSIAEKGIIEPLVVRPMNGHGFEIVAGARRFRAAKLAGLDTVPAIVRHYEDAELLELMLVENIQRSDLSPLEQAAGYRALIQANPDKHNVSTIAQRVGMSPAWVWDRLKLNDLVPAAKALLESERISVGHAIPIARLKAEDQERVIDETMGGLWQHDAGLRFDEDDTSATDEEPCKTCDGTGYVCDACGQADGECGCDEGPELRRCTECAGPPMRAASESMKARSIRELETWIRSHVRFDPAHAAQAQPLDFGDIVQVVDAALERPGRGKKVVSLTFDYQPAADVKDPADRIYGRQAWEFADSRRGPTCEHAVLGVVVAGVQDYGRAFDVCLAKDKCRVHWAALIEQKEQAAQRRETDSEADGSRRKAVPSWQLEEQKRREEREAWAALQPHALQAVAARVKAGKFTAKLLARLFEVYVGHRRETVARLLGTAVVTGENVSRAMELADLVDDAWTRTAFEPVAKRYGVDLKKLEASLAPKDDTVAAPKAKKAAKSAKKGSRR